MNLIPDRSQLEQSYVTASEAEAIQTPFPVLSIRDVSLVRQETED